MGRRDIRPHPFHKTATRGRAVCRCRPPINPVAPC